VPDSLFKTVFLIGFVAGCVIRGACVGRMPRWWRNRQAIAVDRETALDKLLMILASVGMLAIPLAYVLTRRLDFADYHMPRWAGLVAGFVGAAVFAVALWLLWRSHADLGSNFSPEVKISKGHSLVTRGVYQRIRHPMYAAHLLWAIAQVLLLQNWIAGPAFLVVFLPLYLVRVPHEERMLLEHFGEDYRSYMHRTGRLVPRRRMQVD